MTSRRLMTLATYALAYFVLFLAIPRSAGEPARPIFLLIGVLLFLFLNQLRDRMFPVADALVHSSGSRLGTYLRRPWPCMYLCLALLFLPLLVLKGTTGSGSLSALSSVASAYPIWAALVSAGALLWIQPPDGSSDRLFEWWAPCVLILLLGIVGTQRLPELLYLSVAGRNLDLMTSTFPAVLPIVAFAWRVYRNRRDRLP